MVGLSHAPKLCLKGPGDNRMVWEPITTGLPKGLAEIVGWLSDFGDNRPSLADVYKHFEGTDWLENVIFAANAEDDYQIIRYPEIATSVSGLERLPGTCLTDAYPQEWKSDILEIIRSTEAKVACWKVNRRVSNPGRMVEADFWRLSFPFGRAFETTCRLAIILYPVNKAARQNVLDYLNANDAPIPVSLTGKGLLGDEDPGWRPQQSALLA